MRETNLNCCYICPKMELLSHSRGEDALSSQLLWWASFPGRFWTGGTVDVGEGDLPQLSTSCLTVWAGAQRVKVQANRAVASWSLQLFFPWRKWSLLARTGRKMSTAWCHAFPTLYQGLGLSQKHHTAVKWAQALKNSLMIVELY